MFGRYKINHLRITSFVDLNALISLLLFKNVSFIRVYCFADTRL